MKKFVLILMILLMAPAYTVAAEKVFSITGEYYLKGHFNPFEKAKTGDILQGVHADDVERVCDFKQAIVPKDKYFSCVYIGKLREYVKTKQ